MRPQVRHLVQWLLYRVLGGRVQGGGGPLSVSPKEAERFKRGLVTQAKKALAAESSQVHLERARRRPPQAQLLVTTSMSSGATRRLDHKSSR